MKTLLFRLAALFCLFDVAFAGAQNALVRGTVTDPSGAAVPNARVTLAGHGSKQAITSGAAGDFRFAGLSGGSYTLAVEADGFGYYENSSIHVGTTGDLEWQVRLPLQSASQSVTVQGNAATLEQIPSVGKTGTMLQDLPQAVTVVGHELSEAQGALQLADTVRNAAGIIQGGSDGFGFADRFQIRGLEARVFNDGFSDGDEKNGLPHSLNGVERVEVLEGPGSSLFGSGPPGGTVNMVHFTPSPRYSAGAEYQAASFGLNSGSAFITGPLGLRGWNYRVDTLLQHKNGYRPTPTGDYELRPVVGFTANHNVFLVAADGRSLQSVPDPAGLLYVNHTPLTSVARTTLYSTPFGYANQAVGRITASDIWQAKPYLTVTNRFSYMYRHLSILRNGDGGAITGSSLGGRQLRMQHDITHDFDFESEPVWNFKTGHVRHTLLTGTEIQHQSIGTNRATADLSPIQNIFAPVIPETSTVGLQFLRDAKHSGAIDSLTAAYESLYATDQMDLTSRWKLRVGVRQDWWQTALTPLVDVAGRSLGNKVTIQTPFTYTRADTPVSWNVGTVYRVVSGVSTFFGVTRSNLANFNSEGAQNGVQAPESGTQYEAGVKVDALNDRVLMTLAAFHVKRDNVFSLVNDIPVFNDQLTQGGDGSIEVRPARRWKLNANATGMHAALVNNPSNPAVTGKRPQGVPNRIVNLWTSFDVPMGTSKSALTLAGGFSNRSSMFQDLANTNSVPSYTTADLTANFHSGSWKGAFGVRNLTNKLYFTAANGIGGFVGDGRGYFGKIDFQIGGGR